MEPEKIIAVVRGYEVRLQKEKVPKKRMDIDRTLESLTREERLMHAHYLCDRAKEFAANPDKYGKANRHFTAIQMCLGFAGWFTLRDLMNHNRPA